MWLPCRQINNRSDAVNEHVYGGGDTFKLFTDFKAAYVTINRGELFEVMKEFKILQKLIGMVRGTLEHVKSRVKVQNSLSEPFGSSVCVRQGHALSCNDQHK